LREGQNKNIHENVATISAHALTYHKKINSKTQQNLSRGSFASTLCWLLTRNPCLSQQPLILVLDSLTKLLALAAAQYSYKICPWKPYCPRSNLNLFS
jgi:hypothetical protein